MAKSYTYNWNTEVSDCCGANVTGTDTGIACKRCWHECYPREPDPVLDAKALVKRKKL